VGGDTSQKQKTLKPDLDPRDPESKNHAYHLQKRRKMRKKNSGLLKGGPRKTTGWQLSSQGGPTLILDGFQNRFRRKKGA